jgi:hypothetical protein
MRKYAHFSVAIVMASIGLAAPCLRGQPLFDQRITWRCGKEGAAWKTTVADRAGKTEYELALQPLWAAEGGVIAMEIVVSLPSQPDKNLLGDRQNRVEYPFVITVDELTKGLAKSKFGTVRSFQADDLSLRVVIEGSRLGSGVGSGSTFCPECPNIQELSIRISVARKAPGSANASS